MHRHATRDALLWEKIVQRLDQEMGELSAEERRWIVARLAAIGALQKELHAFFQRADGPRACQACRGACCERGKYHPTLANLLIYLLEGRRPPDPDFSRSCPFLGEKGCRMVPGRRPFNCVTFLCETVEERLSPTEREAFYALERELRSHYEALARRYAGAGLRGVLNRAERLEGFSFLARI